MLSDFHQQISAYIYSLLAQRDYSKHKIKEKIQKKFNKKIYQDDDNENKISDEIIDEVIFLFEEKKLINDLHYAQNFIRYKKQTQPRGQKILEQELWKQGIDSNIIAEALNLELTHSDEIQMCETLMNHKLGTYPLEIEHNKKKEKLFRFLLSKGFSFSIISDVFQKMIGSEDGF